MPHQQTQLNTLAFGLTQSRSACVRLRDVALAWVFSAALLFAQGVDLSHSHEGDLPARFDCDICLVTGSLSDALSSAEIGLDFPATLSLFMTASLLMPATPQSGAKPEPPQSRKFPFVYLSRLRASWLRL